MGGWLASLLLAQALSAGPMAGPVLVDLESLEDFKARFNADVGTPRLVLLLSPT